jgi:hypothetical protein
MRGCTQCATQTIRRYRGSDEDLLENFLTAKEEIQRFLHLTDRI